MSIETKHSPNSQANPQKQAKPAFDYEAFRDTIGTVNEDGKRNWLYPKKPKGRYHRMRIAVSIFLLTLLFVGPFLRWNGQPMFLFNVFERKFIIFGLTFWPQDFHLFVLAMLTFMVFIVLFTVVFGRIWCGWACPQTIFMEMVFRKIEYWIEGDRYQQKKLNDGPWNQQKILKKAGKWAIFAAISFLIGNTVMAYLVGTEQLSQLITHPPAENWGKFVGVVAFSGIFFFVFTYLREQACIVVCPYGRLQGVMLDKNSIVVAYDFVRGEPRKRLKKKETREAGDCIDCHLCVQVCPTGIDIRNGTQMECVNCTACMDACDEVMDKVGFQRGLIRYASYNNIFNKEKLKISARIIAYSVVLVALLSVFSFLLISRSNVETTILRTPGMRFQEVEGGYISNLYNVQVVNKTQQAYPVTFKLVSPNGRIKMVGKEDLQVPSQDIAKGALFVEIARDSLHGNKNQIVIEIYSGDQKLDRVKTNFLGPMQYE